MKGLRLNRVIFWLLLAIFTTAILMNLAPEYQAYTERDQRQLLTEELEKLMEAQLVYHKQNWVFTKDLEELEYQLPEGVMMQLFLDDTDCFDVRGRIEGVEKALWINCRGETTESYH